MVSFTPWGKNPRYLFERRLDGSQDAVATRKMSSLRRKSIPFCPSLSLVTVLIELQRLTLCVLYTCKLHLLKLVISCDSVLSGFCSGPSDMQLDHLSDLYAFDRCRSLAVLFLAPVQSDIRRPRGRSVLVDSFF